MKVLMPTVNFPHGHNYMRDFLYDGFKTLGHDVYDVPEGPWLHLPSVSARDRCGLDTDQTWPSHGLTVGEASSWLAAGQFDLVVDVDAFTQPQNVVWARNHIHGSTPLVIVDATDSAKDHRRLIQEAWGRDPNVLFKRELPIGSNWAKPMPLCYPSSRSLAPSKDRAAKGIYYATTHGGVAHVRKAIGSMLSNAGHDVFMSESQQERLTPDALHGVMSRYLIGIHWNPTVWPIPDPTAHSGWDGNRFWENCALGLVNVSLKPFIEFPPGTEFTHDVNVLWANDAEHLVNQVNELAADRDRAFALAVKSHEWFKLNHTSSARVTYLLNAIGLA